VSLLRSSDVGCGVKNGKAQREQMFSVVRPISDIVSGRGDLVQCHLSCTAKRRAMILLWQVLWADLNCSSYLPAAAGAARHFCDAS
jgi:hypothetical protein